MQNRRVNVKGVRCHQICEAKQKTLRKGSLSSKKHEFSVRQAEDSRRYFFSLVVCKLLFFIKWVRRFCDHVD